MLLSQCPTTLQQCPTAVSHNTPPSALHLYTPLRASLFLPWYSAGTYSVPIPLNAEGVQLAAVAFKLTFSSLLASEWTALANSVMLKSQGWLGSVLRRVRIGMYSTYSTLIIYVLRTRYPVIGLSLSFFFFALSPQASASRANESGANVSCRYRYGSL